MGFGDLAVKTSSNKELGANSDGHGDLRERAGYLMVVTVDCSVNYNLESLPALDFDVFVVSNVLKGNLGTLGIEHDGALLVWPLLESHGKVVKTLAVGLLVSLREVNSCNLHSCVQHLHNLVHIAVVRPK